MPIRVILKELTFIDGPNAELAFDGGDQRRALKDGAGEGLQGACDLGDVGHGRVEAGDANVFLAGTLLGLDKAGGAVDADNEIAGDLGIEGTGVAGADVEAVVVFEENGPLGGVDGGSEALRLYHQPLIFACLFLFHHLAAAALLLLLALRLRHAECRVLGLRLQTLNQGFD